ncbi:restriction endonuclease subunit S [Lactobacillus johnsonii]|uniref:Restriction endonuclease subunit S n=1 Tax=Lactobacillus johnsonii TaxID=33959 RepID=A0A9X5AKC6_LACJH|nr:restriction endonuclease subunit S [Lactobacillus johnsonii]MTE02436.1 restriction endonuclease subunit S [Lactobacillus johnsonii]
MHFPLLVWEQRKLGDMANILRGASPRPIKDKKWFDTNSRIGWIRISDVTSQNGRVYTLGQHLSKKGQEKTRVVSSQTLLLSIAASVGYPVITYVETGVHDGFVIFDKPKFNLDFMFFKLQSIQNIWNKYGQAGSQVNINSSIVANTSISIPNIEEQKRISILLKKIEENIYLQQRKLEQLKLLKRMISLSIYPNFNDRIPIKFNLNSTWNKKKLKNITNYKNGTTHEQHQLLKGKFELINLNSISKEGRLKSSGKYINQQFPTLRKNDIVMILSDIAHGQLIGTSAVIPTNNKYILNQRVASLSPNENLNAVFISKYINLKQRYFKKMAAGMSQINLSKKDVEDFKLWVPNFKEQTKIANLLINFDLIEKNKNKKISYLLNLKKFLLQSLFL